MAPKFIASERLAPARRQALAGGLSLRASCSSVASGCSSDQEALFQQGQPAAMFFTDDVQRDYERMKAAGAEFKMPPTKVTASTIAQANNNCGNMIQISR